MFSNGGYIFRILPKLPSTQKVGGINFMPCARYASNWYKPAVKNSAADQMIKKSDAMREQESMGLIETSVAAKRYLQSVQQHEKFMREKTAEFQIGRRHLANMMGEDPDTFTQDDINRAIEYLLPSGLNQKVARPQMLPPEKVFSEQKAAQFDIKGRPFHCFFYTKQANLYQALHDIRGHLNALDKHEDKIVRTVGGVEVIDRLQTDGTRWMTKSELEKKILEPVPDALYEKFLLAMNRLCEHAYSAQAKDFIMQYRMKIMSMMSNEEIQEPMVGEDGRRYQIAVGTRKTSKAVVKLIEGGSGNFNINNQSILYFYHPTEREQILLPLQIAGLEDKMDVVCEVVRGGITGQAGAIRFAISKALLSFVDEKTRLKMRLAGLLTLDLRRRERKKPGQVKARKKYTWKRR